MDDDGDDKDDTKRRTRNLSEKKRRDQFNMLVNELSSMISTNNRKMDKSTVLKSTISFLKNHNEVTVRSRAHDVQEDWKPAFLSNEEFTYLVLEALEGFVMVFSVNGRIHYVSESITSILGHNPADVVNKTIFELTSEEDRPNLYSLLQNPGLSADPMQTIKEKEIRFQCHLSRGSLDFRDEITYELIQFSGHFRTNLEQMDNDDLAGFQQEPDARILCVCTGRLVTPQLIRDVSLVDSNRNEFTSRHSLEWKFLFLDHRAPPIIGYLPFEVLGTSGYDYYHFDDLEKVVTCHEALMQKGEMTSCYYRFLTKGQQWIWLQTRFYITYHQWNSKPEFVVCTHRVVRVALRILSFRSKQSSPNPFIGPNTLVATSIMDEVRQFDSSSQFFLKGFQNFGQLYLSTLSDLGLDLQDLTSYADISKNTKQESVEPEPVNDGEASRSLVKEQPAEEAMVAMSPSYMSDASEAFATTSYQPLSQPPSVKSASAGSTAGTVATTETTAGTSWPRSAHMRYVAGSDTASLSGESRSSQQNSSRDLNPTAAFYGHAYGSSDGRVMMYPQTLKGPDATLVPQHGIGAQYLEPAPYVGAVSVPGVLPLPLPVIVSPDQAQLQEQLQRKHEELQQMIVRQQEELRQVKEQLLLARFGMLQPLINVPNPYGNQEEIQQTQRLPAQIVYEGGGQRPVVSGYPQQQPPYATGHPHMPQ